MVVPVPVETPGAAVLSHRGATDWLRTIPAAYRFQASLGLYRGSPDTGTPSAPGSA